MKLSYLTTILACFAISIGHSQDTADATSLEETQSAAKRAWRYPKPVSQGGLTGPRADDAIGVQAYYSRDPFGTVWQFYADKCGHTKKFEDKFYERTSGKKGNAKYVIYDQVPRPSTDRYTTFVYSAPKYVAVVTIRPGKNNGEHTFINVAITARVASTINSGSPQDVGKLEGNLSAEYKVSAPPKRLKLDGFYKKYVSASGYPVVASAKVNDYALKEAAFLVDQMLAKRPDLRKAMIEAGSRVVVMSHTELTTDIPDHKHLEPKDYWDRRARGLGGGSRSPVCSCAEENLLGSAGGPYQSQCVLIHEFAHSIHRLGLSKTDKTFELRLRETYLAAREAGLWKGRYAGTNHKEYWAVGVQAWFGAHDRVKTRKELQEYDPGLASLCKNVFGTTNLDYTKPDTRLYGHLAGYAPRFAPSFQWPEKDVHLAWQRRAELEDTPVFTAVTGPRFEITPKTWLVGDHRLNMRVVGLEPRQKVSVVAQRLNFVSRIDAAADDQGQLDLRGESNAESGAPFRVLWSMKRDATIEATREQQVVYLRAEANGKVLAKGALEFSYDGGERVGLITSKTRREDRRGYVYRPPGKGPFPGVLLLGGSRGGAGPRRLAQVLAARGFVCFSLAYFNYEDLPINLHEIPLEYFERAIKALQDPPFVRSDRIAVLGISRGGELALLLGATFPQVKAVVAYAPSHVVWPGLPIKQNNGAAVPAWTYRGETVPYMSEYLDNDAIAKLREKTNSPTAAFDHLLSNASMVESASIPVENTSGPILLISGADDQIWPSTRMAEQVMKRLKEKGHRFENTHLRYEGCGHMVGLPLQPPFFGKSKHPITGDEFNLGGGVEANSHAAWDSWPKVVAFLEEALKK